MFLKLSGNCISIKLGTPCHMLLHDFMMNTFSEYPILSITRCDSAQTLLSRQPLENTSHPGKQSLTFLAAGATAIWMLMLSASSDFASNLSSTLLRKGVYNTVSKVCCIISAMDLNNTQKPCVILCHIVSHGHSWQVSTNSP